MIMYDNYKILNEFASFRIMFTFVNPENKQGRI